MEMITPEKSEFCFIAHCLRDLPRPFGTVEKHTFWYYLKDNNAEEARRDIAEAGWYIIESQCIPTKGKPVAPNAVKQTINRIFRDK